MRETLERYALAYSLLQGTGNFILTALATGRVTLRNSAKNLHFALTQDVLTLAWASGQVLISINGLQSAILL